MNAPNLINTEASARCTTNLPGKPIFPGRNTPLIQKGPPKNVPQTAETEASQKETKETKPAGN